MSEDGSPRHRLMRRTLIAGARAAGLFILIAGIDGVLAITVPGLTDTPRAIVALLAGVILFELLRPARRPRPSAVPGYDETDARGSEELATLRATTLHLRAEIETIEEARRALAIDLDQARERIADVEQANALLQEGTTRVLEESERHRSANVDLETRLQQERARVEKGQRDREREHEALRSAAASLKQEAEHERQRADQGMRELQNALTSAAAVATQRQKLESQNAESAKRLTAALQELEALRSERQRVRREIEETRQRAEVEKNDLRRSLEAASNETQQKAIEKLSDDHEKAVRELVLHRDHAQAAARSLSARVEELDGARAALEKASVERQQSLGEIVAQRDSARAELMALDARLRQMEEDHRVAQIAARQEWNAQLKAELEHASAQHANTLAAHLEEGAERLEELRQALARERERSERLVARPVVDEAALRASIDAQWSAKLQSIVDKLNADHEKDVGQAIAQRESARAEVRALALRLEQMQKEHASRPVVDEQALRASIDAQWSAKLQSIVDKLAADHENDVGEAIAQRESARAEVRALTLRLEQMRKEHESRPVVDEQALRASIDTQWSVKLQTIVSHLASDHEADVGKAIEEREEARASARVLTARVEELQRQAGQAKLAQRPAVDEQTLRESIDAQWSEKLQTIVGHLASDHEADLGKAIEEREAARAEARSLAMKVAQLQTRVRDLQPPPPPPAPAAVDEDERRARADVLQLAEQASAAMRATASGNVPLPPRGRVLFVHHDPTMRNMWREHLGRSGFEVQTAADGLEGLRLVMAGKPDVVVADASMPKMDGRELCQLIKSNQETAGVKVILMTGVYTNEMPIEQGSHEFEADELLRKPVKPEALQAALANLL